MRVPGGVRERRVRRGMSAEQVRQEVRRHIPDALLLCVPKYVVARDQPRLKYRCKAGALVVRGPEVEDQVHYEEEVDYEIEGLEAGTGEEDETDLERNHDETVQYKAYQDPIPGASE